MAHWLILTGEYPPSCGGVGHYTAQVAEALAACGDQVTVACPSAGDAPKVQGVNVLPLPDFYGHQTRRLISSLLDTERRRVLVQYVPQIFGLRGANLPFCFWLHRRARRSGDDMRVMVHEPYFYFGGIRPGPNVLAAVQRVMVAVLLRGSTQTYVSTDAWRPYLAPYWPAGAPAPITLPIPSSIPRWNGIEHVRARRQALLGAAGQHIVGHFGTYGAHVAPLVEDALSGLLEDDPTIVAVCVGGGSDAFVARLLVRYPRMEDRLHSTGRASADQVALTLSACDLLVQPYPDGVTTRRTSIMAGLVNGRPILTTNGRLTEPLWLRSGAVALADAGNSRALVRAARALLDDPPGRHALGVRAEGVYRAEFAIDRTVAQLRGNAAGAAA